MSILSFLSRKQRLAEDSASLNNQSMPQMQYEPKPQNGAHSTWTLQKLGFVPVKDGRCIVCGEWLSSGTLMDYGDGYCHECHNAFSLDDRNGALPEGFSYYLHYIDWLQLRWVEKLLRDGEITKQQAESYQKQVIDAVQAQMQEIQNRSKQADEESRRRRAGYLKL